MHEISYVDPVERKVTMISTNLTWSNILSVRETVTYSPVVVRKKAEAKENEKERRQEQEQEEEKTAFGQEAKITALCGGWQKIKTKIEEASVERFGENAIKGREGFEAVLAMSRRVFGEERERVEQQQQRQSTAVA